MRSNVEAELRSLAEQYASAVDQRDAESFLAIFHTDATLEVHGNPDSDEPTSTMRGHQELAAVTKRIARYPRTFHMLGQSTYETGPDAARGEVYCVANHFDVSQSEPRNHVMFIRYDDRYELRDEGGWKIATRRVLVQWTETRDVDPPRS